MCEGFPLPWGENTIPLPSPLEGEGQGEGFPLPLGERVRPARAWHEPRPGVRGIK